LGTIQAAGGILSAFLLYVIGRTTKPRHRLVIFAVGLLLFALGGCANAWLYNATGVLIFMVCLLLGRPLHDIAYFPIQMQVIDVVSSIERRNKYAYIFNQEFGFFVGRFTGCGLFILLAHQVSDTFALRYALLVVGLVQLLSIVVAKQILAGCESVGASAELVPLGVVDVSLAIPASEANNQPLSVAYTPTE
jgi:YQGE family putative transporter